MTLTIDLTPQEETQLAAAARQEGLDPETLVRNLVKGILPIGDPLDAREQNGSGPQTQVLERFQGTVDHVTDGTASLTMEDERGGLVSAELSAGQMTQFGLSPEEDFECLVTEHGHEIRVTFTPIPRRRLSPGETTPLRARVDDAFRNFDDDF